MREFDGCRTRLLWLALLPLLAGCWSRSAHEVIVYTALDREFSEPVLDAFSAETGIKVLAKYDVESTKTVQLVEGIIAEQNRPRCDLFWNNEILHTLRLQREGLLEAYAAAQAADFPAAYRSPDGYWYGLAGRVRVLVVNTELVAAADRPHSIHDLIDPRWKDQVGLAKPRFGTTATHAAALFAHWGDERARQFFQAACDNVRVMSGNKQVAVAVGRGQLAFGLTDTDDAMVEIDNGRPVEIVFPDQQEGGLGAMFIPNTLCLIKGSANAANARRLLDYLLSPPVEIQLAQGRSAQFPVNTTVTQKSRVPLPDAPLRWMEVDFQAAADQWDASQEFLRETFEAAP